MTTHFNRIHPDTRIGKNSLIGHGSVIGYPGEKERPVIIGINSTIGNFITINSGTIIKDNVIIDDYTCVKKNTQINDNVSIDSHSFIGENVTIGEGTLILYGSRIYDCVKIGKNSRIGGFVAENVIIGNNVSIFGKIIHSFRNPTNWNGGEESPIIEDYVVVGFNASVIGGIRINHHVYIAAGAVISKNVPPYSIVTGINNIVPLKDWNGKLKDSEFWKWDD